MLIGSFGAGHNEFLQTAALVHGNWQADTDLFGLEYDYQNDSLHRPSRVRYFSITETDSRIRRKLSRLGDAEWVEPALEQLEWSDFPERFADLGPISPSGASGRIQYEGVENEEVSEFREFLRAFGDELFAGTGDDELILFEAITDFVPVMLKYMDWTDLFFITQTANHLIASSDTVLTASADAELLTKREESLLKRTFDIVLEFEWFGKGTEKRRAMTVTKYPQYWAEADTEDRAMFDVTIDRGRYGISNVKKIPPSRL